jgi:S1-C subfamily serine protease
MKNKQLKSFLLGLLVSVLLIAAFFTGAIADRLFVIKPLNYFFKRAPSSSQQELDQTGDTSLGEMMQQGDYSVADIAAKASESAVTVSIKKKQQVVDPRGIFDNFGLFGFRAPETQVEEIQRDIGSGFVIEGGLVVTNKHVVGDPNAEYLIIDNEDKEYKVQDIYRDPSLDLAILQVNNFNALPLELGDSDQLRVGEPVIAIGTALGEFRHTVTHGVISGLGRGITARSGLSQVEALEGVIQTDAAINPGNSGGPLINSSGQVIGVNVATAQADNISFAIPINVVKSAVNNFKQTGRFDRPMLGVRYRMITEQAALFNEVPQGAYLVEVLAGGSADQAGLQPRDIITKFDGEKLDENNELASLINQKKVGDRVELEYWRDGQTKNTAVTLKSNQQ